MAAPRKIDWERIEPGWRAGIKSVLQLAADYAEETGVAVSHTAINKHFNKLGVPRDLAAKVQAKAEAIVSASMVSGKVSVETTVTDSEIINVGAVKIATVMLSQRHDIQRQRNLVTKLLSELEATTDYQDLFGELGEIMRSPDDKGQDKRNELYNKVISMSGRIDNMKKLAETLKTLVGLERQAFGIADNADGDKPQDKEPRELSSIEIARKVAMALQLGMRQANQMH